VTTDEFAQLYQTVRPKAIATIRWAHRGSKRDAEDATQQAALELGAQIASGRRTEVTESLLIYRAVDRWKDGQRQLVRQPTRPLERQAPEDACGRGWVETGLLRYQALHNWEHQERDVRASTMAVDIQLAIARLPDELMRQAVHLCWREGQPYAETAKQLRVRKAALVDILGQAKPLLQAALADYRRPLSHPSIPAWNRHVTRPRRPGHQFGRSPDDYLGGARGSVFRDAYQLARRVRVKESRAWTLGNPTGTRPPAPDGSRAPGKFLPGSSPAGQRRSGSRVPRPQPSRAALPLPDPDCPANLPNHENDAA
jgi:DNA-directed RNA polymerase specialized sigma24 family protein